MNYRFVMNSMPLPLNIQEELRFKSRQNTEIKKGVNTELIPRWQLMCYYHLHLHICVNWILNVN